MHSLITSILLYMVTLGHSHAQTAPPVFPEKEEAYWGPYVPPNTILGFAWDLKKTRKGECSNIGKHPQRQWQLWHQIFCGKNRDKLLKKYYRSEAYLRTNYWYQPFVQAAYACILYETGAEDKPVEIWEFQPNALLALYEGKIKAPTSGTFRFVGTAYDYMHVWVNGQTVLECGSFIPALYDGKRVDSCKLRHAPDVQEKFKKLRPQYQFISNRPEFEQQNRELGGIVGGASFHVKEDEVLHLEIAVVSADSNQFGYVLFIEEQGVDEEKSELPLFRTHNLTPDTTSAHQSRYANEHTTPIPFNEDTWIWETEE